MSAKEKTGTGWKSRRRYTPEERIRLLDEADKPWEASARCRDAMGSRQA